MLYFSITVSYRMIKVYYCVNKILLYDISVTYVITLPYQIIMLFGVVIVPIVTQLSTNMKTQFSNMTEQHPIVSSQSLILL